MTVESIDDRITVVRPGARPDDRQPRRARHAHGARPRVPRSPRRTTSSWAPTTVDPTAGRDLRAGVRPGSGHRGPRGRPDPAGRASMSTRRSRLVPVDVLGDAVGQVNVDPPTARVTIPVFSDKDSKTLTISPLITGDPAPGFELRVGDRGATGRHGRRRHRRARTARQHRHRARVDRRAVGERDVRDHPGAADGRRRPRRRRPSASRSRSAR